MDTVCKVCPISNIVILKQNPRFSLLDGQVLTVWLQLFKIDLKKYYVIITSHFCSSNQYMIELLNQYDRRCDDSSSLFFSKVHNGQSFGLNIR